MGGRRVGAAGGGLGGRGGQKGGFKASFDAEVTAEVEELIGGGPIERLDFEAIETAARRRALSIAARAIESRLNADTSDHRAGPWLACPCGGQARYAGRHPKTFTSALGPLTLNRAYFHCVTCGHGFCPRDRALGLDAGGLTPAVLRMVGLVGASVSFEEGGREQQDRRTAWRRDPSQIKLMVARRADPIAWLREALQDVARIPRCGLPITLFKEAAQCLVPVVGLTAARDLALQELDAITRAMTPRATLDPIAFSESIETCQECIDDCLPPPSHGSVAA